MIYYASSPSTPRTDPQLGLAVALLTNYEDLIRDKTPTLFHLGTSPILIFINPSSNWPPSAKQSQASLSDGR